MRFDNKNSITTIIPNMYIQCKDIYKQSINVNTDDIPIEFKKYIKKYKNNLQDYSDIFWSFIFSIIRFLINNISNPTIFNIEQILYKSELIISRNNKCLEILNRKNNKLNCIITAIINVVKSITVIDTEKYKFINSETVDYIIKKKDIELAVSIILNTKSIINIDLEFEEDKFEKIEDIERQYFEDEESIDKKIEIPGGEEDEFEIYQDIEDEEDSEGEKEYDYEEEDSEGEKDYDYEEGDNESEREYDSGDNDGVGKKTVRFREDVYSPKNRYAAKYENKLIQTPKRGKRYNKIYSEELSQYLKTSNVFGLINYSEVTELILSGANFLINYKQMPEKVKNNRINFFGTLV
jgi:uncharacterized protein YoxC